MLSKEQILERNKLIGENRLKTRMKRAKQICKTFRFKIDYNNLNKQQKEHIKMLFVEAKLIYFYLHSINAPGTDVNMLVNNKISYKEFVAKQESTTSLV